MITIRPVRLTNREYAELKQLAQLAKTSVAGYVETLIRSALGEKSDD